MTKRREFRYGTMMSMAMQVRSGVWRIKGDDLPVTKEGVLEVFQRAFLLVVTKEALGNYGFNPLGSFSRIEAVEDEDGTGYVACCDNNALRNIVEGLWGSIDGMTLCLDTEAIGLDVNYFQYLQTPNQRYVSVRDILDGTASACPNVRRFITMLCSHPFTYETYLADERGIGLLDYPEKLRGKTIRAALEIK